MKPLLVLGSSDGALLDLGHSSQAKGKRAPVRLQVPPFIPSKHACRVCLVCGLCWDLDSMETES